MTTEKSIDELITQYEAADRARIAFAWNGKQGIEIGDANRDFRWLVIRRCLEDPQSASPELLADLFLADAALSRHGWGTPTHFAPLGAALLIRGGASSLESFAEGFNESFDTFGACHALELPAELVPILEQAALEKLSNASGSRAKRMESVVRLLAQLRNGTATEGWTTVKPGTRVSNVRVVSTGGASSAGPESPDKPETN